MTRGGHGFSLIELLVTLTIIAILMGLILAVIGRVRQQQEATRCLSNLHQLVEATMMYAADHDGFGPDEESLYTWDALIEPYIQDERIYACPTDVDDMFDLYDTSYEIRDFIEVDIDHPERSFLDHRLLNASPSSLILLFEQIEGWHAEGMRNAAAIDTSARPYTEAEFKANLELTVQ